LQSFEDVDGVFLEDAVRSVDGGVSHGEDADLGMWIGRLARRRVQVVEV
jgi:hypothetical protein